MPDGDPESVRIISHMNWTGSGIAFPRDKWQSVRARSEFLSTGVYILVGHTSDDDDLPRIYIGQGDGVKGRIDSHFQNKVFWDWGIAFVATGSDALNRAHITWLEYALINRAATANRCHLDNGNTPQEPNLSEGERADTRKFLNEILQILPLIAAYQSQPISAITHLAPVSHVEPYGDGTKYKVVFLEPAKKIKPIPSGDAKSGAMQGPRYTRLEKPKEATQLSDLAS